MQFHLNGFRAGDPDVSEGVEVAGRPGQLRQEPGDVPEEVDVLIVGC